MINTFSFVFISVLALTIVLRFWLSSRQMAHVKAHRDAVPPQFADAPDMRAWLESQCIQYTALPVNGQWIVPHTRDQLLGACAANLRARGAEPDMAHLAAHLEVFRNQNGEYVERTDYSLEMLIWHTS